MISCPPKSHMLIFNPSWSRSTSQGQIQIPRVVSSFGSYGWPMMRFTNDVFPTPPCPTKTIFASLSGIFGSLLVTFPKYKLRMLGGSEVKISGGIGSGFPARANVFKCSNDFILGGNVESLLPAKNRESRLVNDENTSGSSLRPVSSN